MAASATNTSRELGAVFGVAVLGALVNAHLTSGLTGRLHALEIPANFISIIINAVETGIVPSGVKGGGTIEDKVIVAAYAAFRSGLQTALCWRRGPGSSGPPSWLPPPSPSAVSRLGTPGPRREPRRRALRAGLGTLSQAAPDDDFASSWPSWLTISWRECPGRGRSACRTPGAARGAGQAHYRPGRAGHLRVRRPVATTGSYRRWRSP